MVGPIPFSPKTLFLCFFFCSVYRGFDKILNFVCVFHIIKQINIQTFGAKQLYFCHFESNPASFGPIIVVLFFSRSLFWQSGFVFLFFVFFLLLLVSYSVWISIDKDGKCFRERIIFHWFLSDCGHIDIVSELPISWADDSCAQPRSMIFITGIPARYEQKLSSACDVFIFHLKQDQQFTYSTIRT